MKVRFRADDDCDEGKSAAYTSGVQTSTAEACVSDRRGRHRCRLYASEKDVLSTLRRRGATLSDLRWRTCLATGATRTGRVVSYSFLRQKRRRPWPRIPKAG